MNLSSGSSLGLNMIKFFPRYHLHNSTLFIASECDPSSHHILSFSIYSFSCPSATCLIMDFLVMLNLEKGRSWKTHLIYSRAMVLHHTWFQWIHQRMTKIHSFWSAHKMIVDLILEKCHKQEKLEGMMCATVMKMQNTPGMNDLLYCLRRCWIQRRYSRKNTVLWKDLMRVPSIWFVLQVFRRT